MTTQQQASLAYLISGVIHTLVFGGLILSSVPSLFTPRFEARAVSTTVRGIDADAKKTEPPPADVAVEPSPVASTALAHVEPAADGSVSPQSPGLAEFARQRLAESSESLAEKSHAQQVSELETLGRELRKVANEESVGELASTLSGWLGADKRASAPAGKPSDPAEPLDVSTAQISDVRRETEGEQVRYVAVLVDAAGRTQETQLDPADGEELHKVFDLMKRFPLLETVYRNTAMGLLDKMLTEAPPAPSSDGSATEPASSSAPPEQTGVSDSP